MCQYLSLSPCLHRVCVSRVFLLRVRPYKFSDGILLYSFVCYFTVGGSQGFESPSRNNCMCEVYFKPSSVRDCSRCVIARRAILRASILSRFFVLVLSLYAPHRALALPFLKVEVRFITKRLSLRTNSGVYAASYVSTCSRRVVGCVH